MKLNIKNQARNQQEHSLLASANCSTTMTETRKAQIEKLAIEAHKASEYHRALSMQNVATTTGEREKQAVAYALATAEMFEARKSLDAVLSQPPSCEPESSNVEVCDGGRKTSELKP